MKAYKAEDLRSFTQALFTRDSFDRFLVLEAEFRTCCLFSVRGNTERSWYTDEELEAEQVEDYTSWKKLRPVCFGLIRGRKTEKKEGSYTTYLFEKGLDKILKKVGEESTEVIIAAKDRDKKETVYEIADLAYHVMVLMVEAGISLEDIRDELAARHVIDHKIKQEKMTGDD